VEIVLAILKKKVTVETPEAKILGADIHVEAQQSQFVKMQEEVVYAIGQRDEAIRELHKEVDSLQAQLNNKLSLIDKAETQNEVDKAFIAQLRKFLGN
jgi:TolA-binding protein